VALVASSGEALRQIVGEVTAISDLVDGIAEAAQRQAGGISEISGMVNSMDEFTQQNAAMVEESSASTHNLSGETQRLMGQLGRFQLGRSPAAYGGAPSAARQTGARFRPGAAARGAQGPPRRP
jgi:methyl-accepting chemotaxis protein